MSASSSRATALRPVLRVGRHRGVIVSILVFVVAFLVTASISAGGFSYFELSSLSSGGATLALAAMGQTIIILTGGFDLSAGAVISLVNVVLASGMRANPGSEIVFFMVALAIGGLVGALNGVFVTFMRVQSIVVTLAMMFIVQGVTLLIMNTPGGAIPAGFTNFFTGSAISNILPAPVVVLLVALLLWRLIKNSRFGVGLYAIGSDEEAARAAGIATRWVKFGAYVLGGVFYGAAGAFVSAQTASADPLVGQPLLLEIFAAVVIGGTVFGGGRGGCLGSVFGAYTLMIIVNILLVLNVSAYYSSIHRAWRAAWSTRTCSGWRGWPSCSSWPSVTCPRCSPCPRAWATSPPASPAPLVAYRLARGTGRRAALWHNAFGMTDLVVALTLGALTGFQLVHVTPSAAPIFELPTIR